MTDVLLLLFSFFFTSILIFFYWKRHYFWINPCTCHRFTRKDLHLVKCEDTAELQPISSIHSLVAYRFLGVEFSHENDKSVHLLHDTFLEEW